MAMADVDAIHAGERIATLEAIGDQAVELDQQLLGDLEAGEPRVTCPCGLTVKLRDAYRCYFCWVRFCESCAREHFGPREPPTDTQFRRMAERLAFKGVWHRKPFGTPASDTPWFQTEGWPIFDAIIRGTEVALRRAYEGR